MTDPQPTPIGSRRFEQARVRLAKLLARELEAVSDAEVSAYLDHGAPPRPCAWPTDVPT